MKFLSHRCQSIDIHSKPMDWFLYDRDFRHERVNILKDLIKLNIMTLRGVSIFTDFSANLKNRKVKKLEKKSRKQD